MTSLRPILLVEDNLRDIELTLAAWKRNHVANQIVVARHGGEALDYLLRRGEFQERAAGNPVVVFLDLNMPKLNGFEVLAWMQKHATSTFPLVITLSYSHLESDIRRAYDLGTSA